MRKEAKRDGRVKNVGSSCVGRKGRIVEPTEKQKVKRQSKEQQERKRKTTRKRTEGVVDRKQGKAQVALVDGRMPSTF